MLGLFKRQMQPQRAPLPVDLQAKLVGGHLTLYNYDGGTAREIVVMLDGEPWPDAPTELAGGLQTSPVAVQASSVALRWVNEDGTAGEWGKP